MKPLSERIKDFPASQFVDWLCLACVDVREVRTSDDAQDEINKIREAVTERLATLEDKQRIKQNHIRLRDTYIEELEERAEAAEAIVSDIQNVINLLRDREWAEHCTKTDTGIVLEDLITDLHNDASCAGELKELVPSERDLIAERQNGFQERAIGWNECRAAILSKIEEIGDEKT